MSRNVADKVVMLPLLIGIFGSQFFFGNGFLFGGGSTRRDCYITPWTNWKNCRPLPDGTSVETRIRYVTPASGGGKACSPNLQTKETRPCGQSPGEESKVATNVLLTAVASLTSPFASSKGTLSSGATNLPREKNSKGEYCDVIKTPAGQVLASGNCSPHKSRKRRSVDEEETLASFLKRFRRQILEQFSDIVLLMDKSGSISSSSNMQIIKEVAASIVHVICQAIDLSSDRTRVAVASFDTGFHRHIEMNRFAREDQKPALEAAIKGLNISPNGGTALNAAVDKARSNILHDKSKGSRYKDPRVRQMTFVISDGCGNGNDNLTPEIVRDRYIAEGSCIVSVFIGNDKNCKDHMQAFDTKCTCFQQFFYSSFADAKKNLVDEINKIPAGFCAAPTWNDLLLKC